MAKHIACGDVVAGCQFTAQAELATSLRRFLAARR
jgi:predicted small metal-binding protein